MNGHKYVLDSNIIILLSKHQIESSQILDNQSLYFISVITYMEVLGYSFQTQDEEKFLKEVIALFKVIFLDQLIVDQVINLRKKYKLKLPDAIIASTTILNDSILVSNDKQFQQINELILKKV